MSSSDVFVFFDLDDTLLDFGKAETAALTHALAELSVDVTDDMIAQYKLFNLSCWEALERGEMKREDVLVTRFKMLFDKFALLLSPEKAQNIYESRLKIGHYFVPGAEELLEQLSEKYRLFIVSNGNISTQSSRLESSGIAHYFENIFVSEIIGANKPSKRFFDRCFEQIDGFDPAHAIIIGDSLTSDIQGGINAGIMTCLFDPRNRHADSSAAAHRVSSLAEIPALLSKIF